MVSKLPFEALRAFVYAAQSNSFRIASEKLNITCGAVSQRVAALEAHLRQKLFERTPQGIELLPAGTRLLKDVSGAVKTIETQLTVSTRVQRLKIQTIGSFANLWVIPRLGRFHEQHPNIEVTVRTNTSLTNLTKGGVTADVALRYGKGQYPDLIAHEVLKPSLCLIISPTLLRDAEHQGVSDLLRAFPIVRSNHDFEWHCWLESLEMSADEITWGAALEDDSNVIEAVLAGQGIGSVRRLYIADHARAGRLAVIATDNGPEESFFLVGNKERMACKDAQALHKWLTREARSTAP